MHPLRLQGRNSDCVPSLSYAYQELFFGTFSLQVALGDYGVVAEYKHVTLWETPLTNSDFAKAKADENYTPTGTLTQGWYNYQLTRASQLLTQELPEEPLYSGKAFSLSPSVVCR